MARAKVSEAELAAVVVAWLEEQGADVYQEVECASGVADIVARIRKELSIIETKVAWSLELLCQAMERRREAHRVYMAAPPSRRMRDVAQLCRELGIGLLEVHIGAEGCDAGSGYGMPSVREVVQSKRWNTRPVALARRLAPEHKTHARAGTNGGRWTPFRSTCEQVEAAVRARPGITVKEVVEEIKHHYRTGASARSSIAHWIFHGKIAGVRFDQDTGTLQPTGVR